MITQQRAKELWSYDNLTGVFTSRRYKGRVVGTLTKAGYRVIEAAGVQYLAHRLAWLYWYGTPPSLIDHIDCNKDNNSIENLREASISENDWNMNAHSDNTLGIKGVCSTGKGTFKAAVGKHGKVHQAYFKTVEEASAWVTTKRAELHGTFQRS